MSTDASVLLPEGARALGRKLVGRDVVEDVWTFQLAERLAAPVFTAPTLLNSFDTDDLDVFRAVERAVRAVERAVRAHLGGVPRHLYKAELKAREQTKARSSCEGQVLIGAARRGADGRGGTGTARPRPRTSGHWWDPDGSCSSCGWHGRVRGSDFRMVVATAG